MAKAVLALAKASALCQADGARPGLERAVGRQYFESKVSSSCQGWMRPPGCSCSPAFLTPRCCWTPCSSGNPWQAKRAGAERGAGLAPSLTLFRIFRNMNCHGYQSLGSSLATFALDVRLTQLFPHSTGRSCSCWAPGRAMASPAATTRLRDEKAAWEPGTVREGSPAQEPGSTAGRQQHHQGTGCSPALILLFPPDPNHSLCHVDALHPFTPQ